MCDLNEEFDLTEVGRCNYNSIHDIESTVNEVYNLLPLKTSDWNDDMRGRFSRTGTLCSRCNAEDGFYPHAYSFDVTYIQCPMASLTGGSMCYQRSSHLLFFTLLFCVTKSVSTLHIFKDLSLQPNHYMATFYSISILNFK